VSACVADPSLARPLANAPAYLRAEIAHGVTHEGALHLEDLLLYRTRLDYEMPDHGLAALDEIAEIAAPLLGWDSDQVEAEKAAYRTQIAAYELAITATDDAAAQTTRDAAPELTPMLDLPLPN